jgi:hypothetical protein
LGGKVWQERSSKMHKFESLGTITQEKQEELWRVNISGSRVKSILDPVERVTQFKIIVGQELPDNSWKENPTTKKKLASGHIMEGVIVENFRQSIPALAPRIMTDKRTFVSKDYEHMSANIDAYVITEEGYKLFQAGKITQDECINYIEQILEVKNTAVMDDEDLKLAYSQQANFYSWFFNAKKAPYIIYCRQGYDFGYIEIPYNVKKYEKEVITKLVEFINMVKMGTPPELPEVFGSELCSVYPTDGDGNTIEFYNQMMEVNVLNQKEKELKKQLDDAKAAIKNFVGDNYKNAVKFVATAPDGTEVSIDYRVQKTGGKQDWQSALDLWRMQYLAAREQAKVDGFDLDKYLILDLQAPKKTDAKETQFLTIKAKGGK